MLMNGGAPHVIPINIKNANERFVPTFYMEHGALHYSLAFVLSLCANTFAILYNQIINRKTAKYETVGIERSLNESAASELTILKANSNGTAIYELLQFQL